MAEVLLTIFGLVGNVESIFQKRAASADRSSQAEGRLQGPSASIRPQDIQELRQKGLGPTEIAKRLKIGRSSVYRALAA
jgi:DNA invertase Pin-like site-specific DNA recombinase